jgi:hypothetical protein
MIISTGYPKEYARKHPDKIVKDLSLWNDRPGLLAHAILYASNYCVNEHLDELTTKIKCDIPVVREGCIQAIHMIATRESDDYMKWAINELNKIANNDESTDIKNITNELLLGLINSLLTACRAYPCAH